MGVPSALRPKDLCKNYVSFSWFYYPQKSAPILDIYSQVDKRNKSHSY